MALVPWFPDYDILFPGVQTFVHGMNVFDEWAISLFKTVGRFLWDALVREGRREIGYYTHEVAIATRHTLMDTVARMMENTRWVLTTGPSSIYRHIEAYYQELPKITPPQARALARRLDLKVPDRVNLEREDTQSGEVIEFYQAPGGAHQRVTPDWMLPLILGLYGDITPLWGEYIREIEEEEDGPKKKKRRRY
ncbi:minor capsid protein VP3 [Taphozous melanopogon polyomavirus 1]|nr:minor capsid protein VP3 [Taphozous melanopogon polyomavirus 1]